MIQLELRLVLFSLLLAVKMAILFGTSAVEDAAQSEGDHVMATPIAPVDVAKENPVASAEVVSETGAEMDQDEECVPDMAMGYQSRLLCMVARMAGQDLTVASVSQLCEACKPSLPGLIREAVVSSKG